MSVCRACLSDNDDVEMLDLTDEILNNYNLLTNLQITLLDGRPQKLCNHCLDTIQLFISFRNKCISSESSIQAIATFCKDEKDVIVKTESVNYMKVENKYDVKEEPDINIDDDEVDTGQFLTDCFAEEVPSDYEVDYMYLVKAEDSHTNVRKYKTKKRKSKRLKSLKKLVKVKVEIEDGDIEKLELPVKRENEETNDKSIPCGLCPKSFEDNTVLLVHLESHGRDVSCQYCFECFLDSSHVFSHRLKHVPINKRACPFCCKKFRRDYYLEYHIRTTHCNVKFEGLQCKICLKTYGTPTKLRKHVSLLHSNKVFQCSFCTKVVKSSQLLKSHLRVHSTEKKFVCDSCGYSCKFPGTLKDHKLRKHSAEKHECKHCSRMFEKKTAFEGHSCKKLFICSTCGKEFQNRGSYNRHKQSHSDERRYECGRCPAKYKSKGALQVHVDRHDGVRSKQCEYCSAKFYSTSVLIKHRRVHTGEKPYVCKVCKKGFTGGHNLKVHMKVHGEMLVVKRNVDTEEGKEEPEDVQIKPGQFHSGQTTLT